MFKKYAKIINRGFNSIGIGDILSQPDSNGYYEILLDEEKCISNLCHAYNHIIMAQEIEDIKRAERFLMEAEELDEENAQLYETFGIIYEKIDEEKASKYYYKGYELIVHNLKRYKYLIQCLESKGERQILREYNTHLLMLHIRSAILANKAGIDIDDVKIFNFAVQTISMYFHNIRTARLGEDEHGENEYINALCYVPVIKHVIDTCLRRYLPHIPHSRNEFMKIIKNEIINLIMSIDIDRFLGKAENFIALLDILGNRLKDQINKAITEQLNCMKKT
jgi:tetratricopeptide (TPR) repeat protein